jgi:hypothetical protein
MPFVLGRGAKGYIARGGSFWAFLVGFFSQPAGVMTILIGTRTIGWKPTSSQRLLSSPRICK